MRKGEYRQVLYKDYPTNLAGTAKPAGSREEVRKMFPLWDVYYGRHLPRKKKTVILEIGCGCGDFIYYLQQAGYENVLGVDISEEQVQSARRLGIENIKEGDLRSLLKSQMMAFEVIIARDILEHFTKEEVIEVMDLIFQALRPGGRLIIHTINGESPFAMGDRYGDFSHEICFTRHSLGTVLKMAGFRTFNFYPAGPVPAYSSFSAVRYLLWRGIEMVLGICNLIETGMRGRIFTRNLIAVACK